MIHRERVWVLIVVAAGGAAAEWLRQPSSVWVWISWAMVLAAIAVCWPLRGWRRRGLALLLGALAASLTLGHVELNAIETRWADEREDRVAAAYEQFDGDLHAALHRAERLAEAAIAASAGLRVTALRTLDRLTPDRGPEMSVVVFDQQGEPWAWGGRHRLPPRMEGDSFAVRTSGYYVVLEARRHSDDGRTVVAGVLIWAHPAVPDGDRSLAELFRRDTEVGLAMYAPGTAPDSVEVFEYEQPTTAGRRLLFSAEPIPPEQGAARELVYHQTSRAAIWLVLLAFVLALTMATGPVERFMLLGLILWLTARAPVGAALGLEPLFSPATFFRSLLGPLSSSAGVLALSGVLLTMAAVWLWRRRLPRRWYTILLGVLLLLAAPYLVSDLGRGITPPARGVSVGLWLTWQLTLLVAASSLIVGAAALFRGRGPETDTRWRIVVGVVIAFVATVVGVLIWSPRGGWPDWYTFLWTPALLLVALPAPRWAAITGIALVAGSSAALVTWGAELSGRVQVAGRDVGRLGEEPDPLVVPLLERFGDQLRRSPRPANGSEMYALWHGSALSNQGYPAHVALWSSTGELRDDLLLDSLTVSQADLASLVRSLPANDTIRVSELVRVPGVHYIMLVRLSRHEVMTVAIGPRSELIAQGRVGRLLDQRQRNEPLYSLTLSPPATGPASAPRPRWIRDGWTLRNEYPLVIGGEVRSVHATIDLRGPVPLFVRGILVVLLDTAVLAILWYIAELVAGARPPRLRWRSLSRSFRFRLAVTLAAFFILPLVGFAAWSFTRLASEAQQGRDLLITQTLRDAVAAAGGLFRSPSPPREKLLELSRRIDADLVLYEGGELRATSNPVLEDLSVVGQLMDPEAFEDLALEGELTVTRDGSIPQLAERVGYRVIQPGAPDEVTVLATPQLGNNLSLGVRQLDLAFALLLATLGGVAAALTGAQIAARTLSRPVAELRRSALALGKGQPMPHPSERPPLEFEPVFAAFERMAADIRSSQSALEEARRRTSSVLATVATGVVGVDPGGRVLIANDRAVELLGIDLNEGEPFLERLSSEWTPLSNTVRRFLEDSAASGSLELEVNGRRLTLQLASLGPHLRGAVLALNDVSELSRAERVLAWGEMARQVAHEIKNPLTPMRLGMQHLRRVYRDRREEFDRTLDETADRILAEIDRLDTIARAFSRFGAPAVQDQPLDQIDLAGAVGEVVQLYRLAEEGCEVRLSVEPRSTGAARPDEVKEVMVNLLENARNAGATVVNVRVGPGQIRVSDNGSGIPAELLPRVFEPRFSSRTSGSGLGLAIVRRLVESWGGRVEVESKEGQGTVVTVHLPR